MCLMSVHAETRIYQEANKMISSVLFDSLILVGISVETVHYLLDRSGGKFSRTNKS